MAKENTAQLIGLPPQPQPQPQPPPPPMGQLLLKEELWAEIASVTENRPKFEVVYSVPRVLLLLGTIRVSLALENFPDRSRREMIALAEEILAQFRDYPALYGTLRGEWVRFLQATSGGK